MNQVRTVLGDLDPARLGRVNYHEHLFQVSPLLPGDELDDEGSSRQEACLLAASGFDAMVDATPIGLGRDPEAVARISLASGLGVIATTGAHHEGHYPANHWLRDLPAEPRSRAFLADLTLGMPRRDGDQDRGLAAGPDSGPVRAGLLKAAIGYWSITPFERITLEAVALAHAATGAPVMVHLEFCTAAHEVLDLLDAAGVPAHRVLLAHADRDPNPALHLDLAARGAWLGYDGMARPRTRSDAELLDLTEAVVSGGGADHILLGGDVARRSRYSAYGGMPGLAYLGERYLPQLRTRIGSEVVEGMLTRNAQRFLTWS
ncbi:aryldialkylphosphatase [Cryobacterium sp. Sr8]|uniref:Phosphotriesterase-related protein n=1 Tax=Cryobacterium psychrotolerans TaxID=386301 RepID=A0A1G9ETN1_9MICO|nr:MULTISPECIES: aryldialkylphosphatase [Cryobacterium]TFD41966.1 aryldialkylphosphatase [Cryobacterium sp. TMT1-2-1]TFD76435.1 aryldialkylphosphatase [Cryobacterium sp. Sr8]TFD83624.1 aryldialkylphosphatase [Cryobacterium psychrotolerans]SDK79431.1 phosphotriesterase-related protein [Cryobacterium psychrotolerans]